MIEVFFYNDYKLKEIKVSFIAYCEKKHINKKRAEDVQPKEQNNIFYCQNPKCNCEFSIAALNSNKVRTHFVKRISCNHIEGCWNDINLKESGSKNDYDTSNFSPDGLLNIIKNANDKKADNKVKESPVPKSLSKEHKKEILYIHTVRELFAVCLMNDVDDEINGIKIKEIFAGRKTSYLYTKYISGIKLVECLYNSYDTKSNKIKFSFPYNGNNFIIDIHFDSTELFKEYNKKLYNYKQPILIYAEWNNNHAEITSGKQIIPLKNHK